MEASEAKIKVSRSLRATARAKAEPKPDMCLPSVVRRSKRIERLADPFPIIGSKLLPCFPRLRKTPQP